MMTKYVLTVEFEVLEEKPMEEVVDCCKEVAELLGVVNMLRLEKEVSGS